MATKRGYPPKTQEQIKAEVAKVVEDALPKIRLQSSTPEERKAFLDFMATGYHYSPRNVALIRSQFQNAGLVGSFKFWKDKGFSVQKGEHALKILVPHDLNLYRDPSSNQYLSITKLSKEVQARVKADPDALKTRTSRFYNLGNVFDVLQTNAQAEDYPNLYPNRPFDLDNPNPEGTKKAVETLKEVAKREGIRVTCPETTEFPSYQLGAAKGATINVGGKAKEIVMKNNLGDPEYAATLIHELAHAKMHNADHAGASKFWALKDTKSDKYRDIMEFQAEMTSYVVSKSLGIDTSEEAMPYIASWTKNLKTIEGNEEQQQAAIMGDVQRVSKDLIESIQDGLAPQQNKAAGKEIAKPKQLARS